MYVCANTQAGMDILDMRDDKLIDDGSDDTADLLPCIGESSTNASG